jgi:hypothetical protein
VYDQKYHPLDEVIRPSQAAKRRTLHGEQPLLGSGSDGETSEESASVFGSMAEDEDSDPGESQPTRDRKRKRARSLTPGPTRRSSRRRSKPKTSYNMNIHPQDSDLKRVWACDGPQSSPSPNKGSGSTTVFTSTRKTRSDEFEEVRRTLLEDDLEGMRSVLAHQLVPVGHTDHVQTRYQNQHQRSRTLQIIIRLQGVWLSVMTELPATAKPCVRSLGVSLLTKMYGQL